jgi:hypothetical protein
MWKSLIIYKLHRKNRKIKLRIPEPIVIRGLCTECSHLFQLLSSVLFKVVPVKYVLVSWTYLLYLLLLAKWIIFCKDGQIGRRSLGTTLCTESITFILNKIQSLCHCSSCCLLSACFVLVSCLAYSFTLNIEAICFSETSLDFHLIIRCYIPEVILLTVL